MNKTKALTLSILSVVILISIDQITKKLADKLLSGSHRINVIEDYFIIVYTKNRGGLLSFGNSVDSLFWYLLFIIVPIIVLFILSYYIIKNKLSEPLYLVVWVLVLSGGIGNLIDRIIYGNVTDFLNIGIGDIRSGIFNVADLYIVFFIAIIIIRYITFYIKHKRLPELL